VRTSFPKPERRGAALRELTQAVNCRAWLAHSPNSARILIHEGGASSTTEAAYRFVRHDRVSDVVLFAPATRIILRTTLLACCRAPPLAVPIGRPDKAVRQLVGLGLDRPYTCPGSARCSRPNNGNGRSAAQ